MTSDESMIKHSIWLQFIVIILSYNAIFKGYKSRLTRKEKGCKKSQNIDNPCPMSAILKTEVFALFTPK